MKFILIFCIFVICGKHIKAIKTTKYSKNLPGSNRRIEITNIEHSEGFELGDIKLEDILGSKLLDRILAQNGYSPTKSTQKPSTLPKPPPTKAPRFPPFRIPGKNERPCGFYDEPQMMGLVGGSPARRWPWMVALLERAKERGPRSGQFCGGMLISEFYVLTAAHCLKGYKPKDIKIRIGEYNFEEFDGFLRTRDFEVEAFILHEEYNTRIFNNDIALVKLKKSAYFSSHISPICLPPVGKTYVNKLGLVIGWGTTSFGGPSSNILLEAFLPIRSMKDCKRAYGSQVEITNICAGKNIADMDSCSGDSGGPLQIEVEEGRWMALGIVSFGDECAKPNKPGVYTDVSKYIDWIRQKITTVPQHLDIDPRRRPFSIKSGR